MSYGINKRRSVRIPSYFSNLHLAFQSLKPPFFHESIKDAFVLSHKQATTLPISPNFITCNI